MAMQDRRVLEYREPPARVRWWWRFVYGPAAPLHCLAAASVLVMILIFTVVVWIFLSFA